MSTKKVTIKHKIQGGYDIIHPESELTQLVDVQLNNPTNGQALIYDSVLNKFKNANIPSGENTLFVKFTITYDETIDDNIVTCDTAITEILTAADSGKLVFGTITDDIVLLRLGEWSSEDEWCIFSYNIYNYSSGLEGHIDENTDFWAIEMYDLIIDSGGGSEGDVLTLDENGNPIWQPLQGGGNSIPTGSLNSASTAKTLSCDDFVLKDNSSFVVKITEANNTHNAITLNINNTGAKSVYINGIQSSSGNYNIPAGLYIIYYYSNSYHFNTSHIASSAEFGFVKPSDAVFSQNVHTIQIAVNDDGKLYAKPTSDLTNIQYNDLCTLINNDKLIPGQWYRINDYVTTVNSTQYSNIAQVASNYKYFDIIVLATSGNTLNHQGFAVKHKSTTDYFPDSDLNAWRIWYDVNNDTNRYNWATANGKGVIYRMIDDNGNDCPYDFKNIQFKHNNTWYYTFSTYGNHAIYDYSRNREFCNNNKIGSYLNSDYYYLNNIIFKDDGNDGYCIRNVIGTNCHNIVFESNIKDVIIGNNCSNIIAGSLIERCTIQHNCSDIELYDGYYDVIIEDNCNHIYFRDINDTSHVHSVYGFHINRCNSYIYFGGKTSVFSDVRYYDILTGVGIGSSSPTFISLNLFQGSYFTTIIARVNDNIVERIDGNWTNDTIAMSHYQPTNVNFTFSGNNRCYAEKDLSAGATLTFDIYNDSIENYILIHNTSSSEITIALGATKIDNITATKKIGPAEIKCAANSYIEISVIGFFYGSTKIAIFTASGSLIELT